MRIRPKQILVLYFAQIPYFEVGGNKYRFFEIPKNENVVIAHFKGIRLVFRLERAFFLQTRAVQEITLESGTFLDLPVILELVKGAGCDLEIIFEVAANKLLS